LADYLEDTEEAEETRCCWSPDQQQIKTKFNNFTVCLQMMKTIFSSLAQYVMIGFLY